MVAVGAKRGERLSLLDVFSIALPSLSYRIRSLVGCTGGSHLRMRARSSSGGGALADVTVAWLRYENDGFECF